MAGTVKIEMTTTTQRSTVDPTFLIMYEMGTQLIDPAHHLLTDHYDDADSLTTILKTQKRPWQYQEVTNPASKTYSRFLDPTDPDDTDEGPWMTWKFK